MDKQKRSLNNSASLGKTLTRIKNPQQHQSFFLVPKEFDQNSIKQGKDVNFTAVRKEESTPKISDFMVMAHKCDTLGDSISKIIKNRKKCQKIGMNIQDSILQKSLAINKLYRDTHHFLVCIDQLKWILNEGNSLIQSYLSKTTLISPDSIHTKDINNIAKEFKSLVSRFGMIQKGKFASIQQFLILDRMQKVTNMEQEFGRKQDPERNLPCLSKNISCITEQKFGGKRQSRNSSILDSKQFVTCSVKQNINSLNQTSEFDNIRVEKQPVHKHNNKSRQSKQIGISTAAQEGELKKAKQDFYIQLNSLNTKNQQLLVKIQLLQEEIIILEGKTTKYKVGSFKSIQQLSQILSNLMIKSSQQEREFQLLRMAQCIAGWEKMMEDQAAENKYKQLYDNPQKIQSQRTQKLQQIIQLQYEINYLLGQKKNIKHQDNLLVQNKIQRKNDADDMYRMILMQAFTLEELCKL